MRRNGKTGPTTHRSRREDEKKTTDAAGRPSARSSKLRDLGNGPTAISCAKTSPNEIQIICARGK